MAFSQEKNIIINSNIAISVRNLSKKYHLNKSEKHGLTQDATDNSRHDDHGEFDALKDVSFDLMNGDVVGIIGSNGSGKTTLLRILSEITKPSSGEAIINGSVSSILDIGSNFHPDLTGYENTLMQLRIREIPKGDYIDLLKKIRHFSGIEEFFEQPVKFYSNGMFLRLAFSVAFNISADILILDEVLSVGDEGFRLKSHTLMQQFKAAGKTILFVTHSRNEILELCDKCIWLDRGIVQKIGTPTEVLAQYFEMQKENYEIEQRKDEGLSKGMESEALKDGIDKLWSDADNAGNEFFAVRRVSISQNGSEAIMLTSDAIDISILIEKKKAGGSINTLLIINDVFYQPVLISHILNNSTDQNYEEAFIDETGMLELKCTIPGNFLAEGVYYMLIRFGINTTTYTSDKNPKLIDDIMQKNTGNEDERDADHDYHLPANLKFRLRNKPGSKDVIGRSINGSVRPALDWSYTKKGDL